MEVVGNGWIWPAVRGSTRPRWEQREANGRRAMLGEHMGLLIAARHQKVGAGSVLNAGGGGAGLLADQGAMVSRERKREDKR